MSDIAAGKRPAKPAPHGVGHRLSEDARRLSVVSDTVQEVRGEAPVADGVRHRARHNRGVSDAVRYEVRLPGGRSEVADSLWGARHVVARAAAFDKDPTRPVNVLPAEIWKLDPAKFGGRVFVETISSVAELSQLESG